MNECTNDDIESKVWAQCELFVPTFHSKTDCT